MKGKHLLIFAFTSLLLFNCSTNVQAQEVEQKDNKTKNSDTNIQEILVQATTLPEDQFKAGVGVETFSEERLENMKPNTLDEVLRTIPGISIRQNASGKLTSISLRGGKSGSTMILVDGMPINDIAGIDNEIDISSLPIDNIEKIEVVKGPAGAIYGPAAMNGAINIITKKGGNKPIQGNAMFQSMLWKQNFKGGASLYGSSGIVNYRIQGSGSYDENISAAAEKYGNAEKDPDSMVSASGYLGINPSDAYNTEFQIDYADRDSDIDNGGGYGNDAIDYKQRTRRVSTYWKNKFLYNDIWEPTLNFGYVYSNRTYGTSKKYYDKTEDYFDGHSFKTDFNNNIYIADEFTLALGAMYEYVKIESRASKNLAEKDDHKFAVYAKGTLDLFDSWTTILAYRGQKEGEKIDFANLFNISSTFTPLNLGKGQDIKEYYNFQIKVGVGNGSMAPSLYQLYDPAWGNPRLRTQESLGYEIGIANNFYKRMVSLDVAWFQNYYKNYISWGTYINDFNSISNGFYNNTKAKTHGIETTLGVYPIEQFAIEFEYMWLQTFDEFDYPLPRKPEHKFTGRFIIKPIKNLHILVEGIYSGKNAPSPADDINELNEDYFILNASINYIINDNFEIYLKGTNLTDTQYEEIYGYGMKGIEVFAGLKMKI